MTIFQRRQKSKLLLALGCGALFSLNSLHADQPFATKVLEAPAAGNVIQQVGCFDGNCCEPECGCEPDCGCESTVGCDADGCDGTAAAKKKKEALAAKVAGAYKGLFYANDFSYINDPCYRDHLLGDHFKQVAGPCCSKIDFGGEFRTRYHSENNFSTPGLGLTGRGARGNPNAPAKFWLSRLRLFGNWKINDNVRVYGEMIHADMGGFAYHAPRPIEVNRHDIQNLFVDFKLFDLDGVSLAFRPGRQELLYGAQRLISPLDWANTRRTFDGVKLMGGTKNWSVDGFWVNPMDRPVARNFHHNEIDERNEDVKFYGVYGSRKGLKAGQAFDLYYLGLNNQSGANDFNYHTVGNRFAGKDAASGISYEFEGGLQFGDNTDGSTHFAGAATVGLGRQFAVHDTFKPIIWMWYDYASGGDVAGNGWHHMFPLAHKYNGFMDLFGRRNLHDINAQFILPVNKKLKLLVWYHYFLMDKATNPSNVVMGTFGGVNAARERELGHEIDLAATITMSPRQQVFMGYSFFDSGKFYTNPANTVPHRGDAQFVYCQWHYRF